jgi:hypothetical protein
MCIGVTLPGNGSANRYRGTEYKLNSRRIVARVTFYTILVLRKYAVISSQKFLF